MRSYFNAQSTRCGHLSGARTDGKFAGRFDDSANLATLSAVFRLIRRRADLFRRFVAAGAAALIFALGVFAASPALHAWLHDQTTLPANDDCAVVHFAAGVSAPLGAMVIVPPATVWCETVRAATTDIFLVSPRYLRQPERGPPFLG